MQRFFEYSRLLATQAPVANATINVYDVGTTTPATIYSDDGVTLAANPLTADANGFFFFYAANGRYDVRHSGGTPAHPAAFTWGDVLLYDSTD
jgi:hypothetical protein